MLSDIKTVDIHDPSKLAPCPGCLGSRAGMSRNCPCLVTTKTISFFSVISQPSRGWLNKPHQKWMGRLFINLLQRKQMETLLITHTRTPHHTGSPDLLPQCHHGTGVKSQWVEHLPRMHVNLGFVRTLYSNLQAQCSEGGGRRVSSSRSAWAT